MRNWERKNAGKKEKQGKSKTYKKRVLLIHNYNTIIGLSEVIAILQTLNIIMKKRKNLRGEKIRKMKWTIFLDKLWK